MAYPYLFESFEIKDLVVPNRILMAAMGNNLSGERGVISPRAMAYYLARARGGVGMIITEAVAVSLVGRHRAGGLCLFQDEHQEGLGQLVEALHQAGSKLAIQLNHGGRLVDPRVSGGRAVAPSEIASPPWKAVPEALSINGIEETVSQFAAAAKRAVDIGFDAMEIHGAHGYLIHQFFSPRSNQRKDRYGGSLENRMRFPVEVAGAVRAAVGDKIPLIFRLSAEEYEKEGYPVEDALALGRALKEAGIDLLHISAGTTENAHSSLYCIQPGALPEGCLIHFAERFRKEVGPPVVGVGRISTPETAEELLEERKADLVAVGRGLVADPEWPNKASGRSKGPLRKCIGCNRCIEAISSQQPICCSVNPVAGFEYTRLPKMPKHLKRILVVGAGPAGLEAACTASDLGHRVSLYEREDRIGGQLWEASMPPKKGLLKSITDYYGARLSQSTVEVHLGKEVTKETMKEEDVDVIVLATGSKPLRPPIAGADDSRVVTARDVLRCECDLEQDILVIGGGLVGCETAEFLAEKGKGVQIIEMLEGVAGDVEPRTRVLLLERLKGLGVVITTECRVETIGPGCVEVETGGRNLTIPAGQVVLAVGSQAEKGLEGQLRKGNWNVLSAGDCRTPANIREAVHQGFRVICEGLEEA